MGSCLSMSTDGAESGLRRWSGGQDRTRTCDLFCESVVERESIMSTPDIWRNIVHTITTFRGQDVYRIHNFHACHYWLHPVAPDWIEML